MTPRPALALLLAALALLLVASLAGCQRPPEPRSVVLFVIDTLRADAIGPYGRDPSPTPFLDALAAESVVFEHAYAPAPWTLPSTVSLLTSQPLCEHRVVVDGDRVAQEAATLAERLRAAGFATASFFSNPYAGRLSGLDRGFQQGHLDPDGTGGEELGAWLRARAPGRFFVYVHNVEPHDPYEAPPSLQARPVPPAEQQRANDLVQRYRGLARADWAARRPRDSHADPGELEAARTSLGALRDTLTVLYEADVGLADARLASVVAQLRLAGRLDETLLIVVSDHGEAFGEHAGWQHDHALYDEVVRVPLLVRFPGAAHAGRRIAAPVSLLDVVPTVAEALGRPALAAGARGLSLLPLIEDGEASDGGAPRVVSIRWNLKKRYTADLATRGDLNVAVREGRWKAIWNAEPGTVELYDLAEDPGERVDRSGAEPERAARLAALAREAAGPCLASPRGEAGAPELDAATREQLEHLGYLDE